MAKSKLMTANEKMAEKVVTAYKKSKTQLSAAIKKLRMLLLTAIWLKTGKALKKQKPD